MTPPFTRSLWKWGASSYVKINVFCRNKDANIICCNIDSLLSTFTISLLHYRFRCLGKLCWFVYTDCFFHCFRFWFYNNNKRFQKEAGQKRLACWKTNLSNWIWISFCRFNQLTFEISCMSLVKQMKKITTSKTKPISLSRGISHQLHDTDKKSPSAFVFGNCFCL